MIGPLATDRHFVAAAEPSRHSRQADTDGTPVAPGKAWASSASEIQVNDATGVRGMDAPAVSELRLVVTAADYDEALHFYRDALGLPQLAEFSSPGGRVVLLDAGRATLELTDPVNAEYVDDVEVGRRVAGHIRVAFEVADTPAATRRLVDAGASLIAEPTTTPWNSLNARLEAPAGLQLTLFSDAGS